MVLIVRVSSNLSVTKMAKCYGAYMAKRRMKTAMFKRVMKSWRVTITRPTNTCFVPHPSPHATLQTSLKFKLEESSPAACSTC